MHNFFYNIMPELRDNWDDIKYMFKEVDMESKTIILREGEVADSLYLINEGCLRLWFNDNGKDITFQFFFETQAVTSIESFYNDLPSSFNLETLENSKVTVIKKDDIKKLLSMYPSLKDYSAEFMADRLTYYTRLFLAQIKNTPEQRYKLLISSQPEILKRIPHHYIASFLGITNVSLSRLRKRITEQENI